MDDQPSESGEGAPRPAIIGAGTMGRNIAVASAVGGQPVTLFDIDEDALAEAEAEIRSTVGTLVDRGVGDTTDVSAVRDRVAYATDLAAAVGDAPLIVEAVTEDREVKAAVYEDLEREAPTTATIATNTSSLSITELASSLSHPERFCGMHWFHPAHIVPVVEVVYGDRTTDEAVDTATAFLESIGKDPVVVERDIPGFIANRIQSAMAREAWALLESGVASAEDIDRAVKGTFGFRLPTLGVLEKGDHSGLDVHHKVLTELLGEIDRQREPAPVLTELVEAGRHGVKTDRGVYDWSDADLDRVTAERDQRLLDQLEVYRAARGPPDVPDESESDP
ncbi:3-hydroxyacyl-CoA dehydrogenase family protein [Natrinema salsiterrestre]|uniref:3-hydroxyacyl-CoA dehydrogenase family protein n=1 Tax=Natrinema salsiterrestre TaxID=2950540 RepID=A0A9Q4L142_9EURY|nr:3-hydroxyacyl-CoA dehydrogenase family protein [Natrinema salsiterrestre]MDF9746211.1 3-hydroxyacyl-CoA dehydrogenase family protein [Natrinema salsiterrestre]